MTAKHPVSAVVNGDSAAAAASPSTVNRNDRSICPGLDWKWSCLIVVILASATYVSSLDGDFVFDDNEAIVNNEDVKPQTPLVRLFFNDFWGTSLLHKSSHKSYRPLTTLSFRLHYIIDGHLNPKQFHVVNLVLHSICSALSLFVFSLFTGEWGRRRLKLSFIASVLFAIHPVHTEAVAGIVGRADLLCGVFYLLSILAYHRHLGDGSRLLFAASMLSCGLSMFCKEQGITVLGVLAVYDLTVNGFHLRGGPVARCGPRALSATLKRFAWMTLVGLCLLYVRLAVMGSTPPAFQKVDNPASFAQSLTTRFLSYHYVYSLHALLLLWPHWLCFDWSMGCVPLVDSWTDLRNASALLFWFLALSAVYKALFSPCSKQRNYLVLGLALVVIPFLPATNLFFRVGFVVAERVLFIPVAGYCLIFVNGLEKLGRLCPGRTYVWRACLLTLVALYALKSARRTLDWRDEVQLFRSGLAVCPLNAKVHYNIGKNAADRGDRDSAVARYRLALELHSEYDSAMNNLANLLKDAGRLEEAEEWLTKAVQIRKDFAAAWMNLGIVQVLLKKFPDAHESYKAALQHRRKYPDCYYNLGNLYLELERFDEAGEAFRNATALQPTHVLAWTNLIVMLDNIGQLEKSESTALEALQWLPSEANLHFSLAGILGKQNRFKESENRFLTAIALQPSSAVYHTNLGVLYHRWKKFDDAERCYRRALALDSRWKSARDNLNLLLKANGNNSRRP